MSVSKLVKWGNSVGIRIPMQDLHAANAYLGEEFKVIVNPDGGFTLAPIKNPQEGWLEAFNLAANAKQDKLLIDELPNEFDEDEWQW